MYQALKKAKIKATYEGQTYTLQESFAFKVDSYERQANGKGEMVNRGQKKIQSIGKYKRIQKIITCNNIEDHMITILSGKEENALKYCKNLIPTATTQISIS